MMRECHSEILNLSDFSDETWNSLLKNHPEQATVFHSKEWMLALQEAFGFEPRVLTAVLDDDSFAAILPFMIDTRYGIQNYLSMPFDTYGGVVGDVKYAAGLMSDFFGLNGVGVKYCVEFNKPAKAGWETTTELMNISSNPEALWAGLHKDNRTAIRSAWNNWIKTEIRSEQCDLFEKVHPALIAAILKHMAPKGLCAQFVATCKEEPVAASLFFIFGKSAIYWANTVSGRGRQANANYLLMWDAINHMNCIGCTTMNFGASPAGADSLVRFKRSWGTIPYSYTKRQKVPLPLKPILAVRGILK